MRAESECELCVLTDVIDTLQMLCTFPVLNYTIKIFVVDITILRN